MNYFAVKSYCLFLLLVPFTSIPVFVVAQQDNHQKYSAERPLHYRPLGTDFVCVDGKRRFNRALYGTNTGFRVEAGDLPEFALYMPGFGGTLRLGIVQGDHSKWLIDAERIRSIYRPGSMLYEIGDSLLGGSILQVDVLAMSGGEGMIIKVFLQGEQKNAKLFWMFGGASGKKFSRDGDIGADPESSFYLQPENCIDNIFRTRKNSFDLVYGSGKVLSEEERYEILHLRDRKQATDENNGTRRIAGIFPPGGLLSISDAGDQQLPLSVWRARPGLAPVVCGQIALTDTAKYLSLFNPETLDDTNYVALNGHFNEAEKARRELAGRISLVTPDPYLNTLGGALGIAADAIWEDPTYLHGAVAWRMRLNAWRGPYVADPLGWHDRAERHFKAYALSQVRTAPTEAVVMDTALHLARHLEKIGTQLFSDGYICRNPNGDIRAHHYDMNLVFVDQLLNHFNWTGDTAFLRDMWPLITRHLAWEKRNFDADGDGLYDAYAAIWASDALQYSGGGVTHTSAYNYRSHLAASQLAGILGEDPAPFQAEAEKIKSAIGKFLWLPDLGWYAEYKDLLGKQLVHPEPGLWTIYHALDAGLPDAFQAFQSLEYIDHVIPHIPIRAAGWDSGMYLLASTNWQPYTWSINNVALAENLNTALAYWQGNRREEAFRLWRSALMETMYLSASPGGFEQLSYYDAVRGELYRDFADGIGVAARSLVEGLFGIRPDLMHNALLIQPGFPASWDSATLETPDIFFRFSRSGKSETYHIRLQFPRMVNITLRIPARFERVKEVFVNGRPVQWKPAPSPTISPMIDIMVPASGGSRQIEIIGAGSQVRTDHPPIEMEWIHKLDIQYNGQEILGYFDPQRILKTVSVERGAIHAEFNDKLGYRTFFADIRQGDMRWWQPVRLLLRPHISAIDLPVSTGTNSIGEHFDKIDLSGYFNDYVSHIFTNRYLSPRPKSPTLQLPTQGIGNWCYPLVTANIDDRGLLKAAGANHEIRNKDGVPFLVSPDSTSRNILFTSQWDNFPDTFLIPVTGKAQEIFLLMAGTTNPMQSRIVNGRVIAEYANGSPDTLLLRNPQNWWPIEQDLMNDGFAFQTGADIPERFYLKEGYFGQGLPAYETIKGFTGRAIDGGAATVLSLRTDEKRELRSIRLEATANDVIIGLMALTLLRN